MQKPRLPAIEYIRGISMLGVIGIHVGSEYLMNPTPNIHLVALFEIATRFSVPIFFFISAFGLFYNMDLKKPFSYRDFLRRRFRTVLVPYIAWSAFYILHYTFLYKDTMLLNVKEILKYLFFGFASYQLYFMVILLWFYLLMPLWIAIIRRVTPANLTLILIFQIAFNYWSSFIFNPYGIENKYLNALMVNRLNYWVLHYIFIFILGGWLAINIKSFLKFLKTNQCKITLFFLGSLASILCYYYWLISFRHYTPIQAINTAHQLCPAGVVYTIGASIFLFMIFTEQHYPECMNKIFSFLGRHSYFAYLAHPLAITYLDRIVARMGLVMNAPLAIIFYIATATLAVTAASLTRKIGDKIPIINKLTIGVYKD